MIHEDYAGFRHGRGNVAGAGRLQVDTFYATASTTVVDSPIKPMTQGFPEKLSVATRNIEKHSHPHFKLSGDSEVDDGNSDVADQSYDGAAKFMMEAGENYDADYFTPQEINHMCDIVNDGLHGGWTPLDIWDDN
jgi:hypothetical protein